MPSMMQLLRMFDRKLSNLKQHYWNKNWLKTDCEKFYTKNEDKTCPISNGLLSPTWGL